ncbi:MAG: hypothetical protein RSB61_01380 [Clostridia bacterium]
MQNIVVVYGGKSCEKDISTITGIQTLTHLNKKKYKIFPLFVDGNHFFLPKKSQDVKTYIKWKKSQLEVFFIGDYICRASNFGVKKLAKIDCALLCLHGENDEGGGAQGFFDTIGIPYTSADIGASALAMDKALSKLYFASKKCKILPYCELTKAELNDENLAKCVKKLKFPIIVKPNRQGSSIGIDVANDMESLAQAVEIAFSFGNKIVLERALVDFVEINCACVLDKDKVVVSSLEQPLRWNEFLAFEDKYLTNGKLSGGGRIFPATLEGNLNQEIQDTAQSLYLGANMRGVVRFDFLVDKATETAYINEMNTIPGSLGHYLFADKNLSFGAICDILIEQAQKQFDSDKHAQFHSQILSNYNKGSANACKCGAKMVK